MKNGLFFNIYTLLKYSWLKKVLFSLKNRKNFWSTQYTPCLSPRTGHFSNDFWFLYWRMVLETKICILVVLVVTEELLKSFFRPWEIIEYGKMCIYLSMYIHTSIIFPKCNYLYLYSSKHEFILMSPTLILYYMDQSSLFSCISINSHFKVRNTMHLLVCSVPVYINSAFRIVHLHPHRKQLYQL